MASALIAAPSRPADFASALRASVDAQDVVIREARGALEAIRSEATDLEVERATAQSDLTHLAQTCMDAVQVSLDEVLTEVEQMELAGETTPDAAAITAEEPDPEADEETVAAAAADDAPVVAAEPEPAAAAQPPAARRRLQEMKSAIREAVPGAEEWFSYRIPGFRVDGRMLVWYAGFTHHTSLYPVSDAVKRANAAALEGLKTSKGTVQFPLDRPLPVALLKRLVRNRLRELKQRGR